MTSRSRSAATRLSSDLAPNPPKDCPVLPLILETRSAASLIFLNDFSPTSPSDSSCLETLSASSSETRWTILLLATGFLPRLGIEIGDLVGGFRDHGGNIEPLWIVHRSHTDEHRQPLLGLRGK